MNKDRRKRLQRIRDELSDINLRLESIRDEEEDARDALPDSFRDGERGDAMLTAIDSIGFATDQIFAAMDEIDTAMEG